MTTKKAVIIVVAILAAFALIIALFVGGIVGVVFYSIGNSQAADTAKTFLRQNPKLRQDIGEVRDFGFFVTGEIKTRNSAGNAELGLKVVGERKVVNATVVLVSRGGREWRVIESYYDNDAGERVALLGGFEESAGDAGGPVGEGPSGEGPAAEAPAGFAGFDEEGFKTNVLDAPGAVLVVVGSPSSLDSVDLDKTLGQIAPRYEQSVGLVRYDLSEQPFALQRLGLRTVPAVILYRDGEELGREAGKISREQLTSFIDRHLEK